MVAKSQQEKIAETAERLKKAVAGDPTRAALVSAFCNNVETAFAEQRVLIEKLTALVVELNAKLGNKSIKSCKANHKKN